MKSACGEGRTLGLLVKMFPKVSETFILEEILGLERAGISLRLYTLAAPTDAIAHPAVAQVRAPVIQVPATLRGRRRAFARRHLRLFSRAPLTYTRALLAACRRSLADTWRGKGVKGASGEERRFGGKPGFSSASFTGLRAAEWQPESKAGAAPLREFLQAGWLAEQLREDGVDHLHTHFISTPADVAETVSRLTALPFSISAHAKDIYLSAPADLRRKLDAARFTVTCTDFNRRTLASIAPDARIHRMYHGVDHTQFHPCRRAATATPPVILSVGRLREKKGLDTLIDACRVLRRRGEAFRCEIVGYGEEHDRLQSHIAMHELTDTVRLLGKLTREQVIECYARAAVYVQPSRVAADGDRDGIPNVLLEAMAMGLPVVASNVSGIPELVGDGQNGLVVEPDDPVSLADAISRLLHEPELGAALVSRARDTVTRSFDNDHNLKLLCRLLHEDVLPGAEPSRAGLSSSNERAPQAALETE